MQEFGTHERSEVHEECTSYRQATNGYVMPLHLVCFDFGSILFCTNLPKQNPGSQKKTQQSQQIGNAGHMLEKEGRRVIVKLLTRYNNFF